MIEKALAAALENDPSLLVPRFSDLYDTAANAAPHPPAGEPAPLALAA